MIMTKEMIATDVNYRELGLLESHIMHEKNRLGERGLVEKYADKIEETTESDYEFNLMLSLIQYYNKFGIKLPKKKEFENYVIDPIDYWLLEEIEKDKNNENLTEEEDEETCTVDISTLADGALPCFLENHIIKYKIEEAF